MKKKFKKGFTLLELLISVSIVGILAVAISDFYITIVSSRLKAQQIAGVEQQGASASQYIAQLVRNAEEITSPAVGTSGNALTLEVTDAAKDPTVIDVSAGRLRITEGAQTSVFLTDSHTAVTNPLFTNLSRSTTPGVLRISFTLESISQSSVYEYNFSKNFASSAALRY
ncbi:MAG: type II secretion system protein [Patescibacteria group bacterium]